MIALWLFLTLLVGLATGWVIGYCQRENDVRNMRRSHIATELRRISERDAVDFTVRFDAVGPAKVTHAIINGSSVPLRLTFPETWTESEDDDDADD